MNVIQNETLTYDENLEILKKSLIVTDCVLMKDESYKSGISLWVMPCFYSKENLDVLR